MPSPRRRCPQKCPGWAWACLLQFLAFRLVVLSRLHHLAERRLLRASRLLVLVLREGTPMELEKNQPIKGSWDSDWKAAEAKAQAFEEKTNGKQWKSANEGSGKDGAEEPQA